MRKRVLCVLVMVVLATAAFAIPYDSSQVVPVMDNNLAQIRAIGTEIQNKDYFGLAKSFYSIADGMMQVLPMDAPKGSEEHWKNTITEVINVSFQGVGACGVQDDEAIQQAFSRLRQLMQEGHSQHRG